MAYFCLPLLFAVAVLRYRLYDIEVIINRAFVLAVATAFAAVGYAGLVVGVSRRLDAEAETGGFWLSLGALVVVALAFQPLRRSVVRLANRLAYGPRAAPYEALADFSRRLAETPTPEVLLTGVAEAAGRAVSASRASAVLETGPDSTVSAQWPSGGAHDTDPIVVPVRNEGSVLGSIAVSLPRGREIRPAEARLLADLADQAALAFRNAAIAAQLAAHVAELDSTTHRLAESRARIIEADDTARRALESAIAREVLPHLVGLPERLRAVRAADGDGAAVDEVDSLVTETNLSLESLRELTRGVFPTQLARSGIGPALRSHLSRTGGSSSLAIDASAADRRFSARAEAAVYFVVVEAVQAGAAQSRIALALADDELVLEVAGAGRDDVDLAAIVDRVEAAGGSIGEDAESLMVRIPVEARPATQPQPAS